MTLVSRLWKEESGQGMAEYGLILALISVVCLVVLGTIGTNLVNRFQEVADELEPKTTTP